MFRWIDCQETGEVLIGGKSSSFLQDGVFKINRRLKRVDWKERQEFPTRWNVRAAED